MRVFTLALTLVLLTHTGYAATKRLLYVGAGGEPDGSSTIFDSTAKVAGSFFSSRGWQSTVLFDGGHSKSVDDVAHSFKVLPPPFKKAAFQAEIDKVLQSIRDGTLKKGDQFLLVINTHGRERGAGQSTHSVSATDGSISLDELRLLRDALDRAGVKFGLIDFSCYSGGTLALASTNTCVITGSSEDHVFFNLAGENFFSTLGSLKSSLKSSGRSLEDVFLAARSKDPYLGLPQISTQPGRADALKQLQAIKAKLQYGDSNVSSAKECGLDSKPSAFDQLLKDLGDLRGASDLTYKRLVQAVSEYDTLLAQARSLGEELSKFDKKFERIKDPSLYFTWRQLTLPAIQTFEKNARRLADDPAQSEEIRKVSLSYVNAMQQVYQLREKLSERPEFNRVIEMQERYEKLVAGLYGKANRVVAEERKFYSALYRREIAGSRTRNACSEFKL